MLGSSKITQLAMITALEETELALKETIQAQSVNIDKLSKQIRVLRTQFGSHAINFLTSFSYSIKCLFLWRFYGGACPKRGH